jgi:dihydrodipicolinate synthase/N-acetylneuraminate lyase
MEGILMPMPVAFKNDGAIDQSATDAIIDFYLGSGVHGFFPLGTHGQGMVMEIDERKKVAEQIVKRVAGKVPVVMHIGTANTYSSIELAKHAASLGVDAIGVVPPYYYPHDDYEVYAHYKAIAKSVPGVPLFIYDNTETTWVEITPAKANKIIEAIAPNPLASKFLSSPMTNCWVTYTNCRSLQEFFQAGFFLCIRVTPWACAARSIRRQRLSRKPV